MSNGIEIERKFIIEMPDPESLSHLADYTKSSITQTYLESEAGVTLRVRRREYDGCIQLTRTEKRRLDEMSATEIEDEISEAEYEQLLLTKKRGTQPLHKVRHTFSYQNKTVEIDVYPQWQRSAIMEIELESREEKVAIPPSIKALIEVTGDKRYSNAAMSHAFPPEII